MALRADELFVFNKIVETGGMPEVEQAVTLINEYRLTDFYKSKNDMIAAWEIDHQRIYEFVISVFTVALSNESISYQAMVGMLNHKIKLDNELSRIKIVADLIGLVIKTGLIDIYSEQGEYHQLSTAYVLSEPIPADLRHQTITCRPQPIEANWSKETGSVMLGHSMYQHDGYLRLSHLNRMNQIPLSLNKEFIDSYNEAPKSEPVDDEAEFQWEVYRDNSAVKYEELMASGNRYFEMHNYCYRGRTYGGFLLYEYPREQLQEGCYRVIQQRNNRRILMNVILVPLVTIAVILTFLGSFAAILSISVCLFTRTKIAFEKHWTYGLLVIFAILCMAQILIHLAIIIREIPQVGNLLKIGGF